MRLGGTGRGQVRDSPCPTHSTLAGVRVCMMGHYLHINKLTLPGKTVSTFIITK